MQRIIVLIFFVLTLTLSAHAETRYVTDNLLVSLRSAPDDTSAPLERISTGTKVEVIEDFGIFLKIKSPTGTIGFVRSKYFIETSPARTTTAIDKLQEQLTAEMDRNTELAAEVQRLKSMPTAETSATTLPESETSRIETAAIIQERDQLKLDLARLTKTGKTDLFPMGKWTNPYQLYLAGGAILLFGWYVGKSSRPRRRY